MAAFVRTRFENNYRNLDRDAAQHLYDALAGGSATAVKSRNQILGRPDFILEGTTDSNTAALNAGASQSPQLNLTTEGLVEFPDGFDRDITIECFTEDETGPNYQKIVQTVRGGTNPTLVNGVKNIGPTVGGRCTFANSGTDIVAADAWGGFSVTLDATATGRFAAAIPKARRAFLKSLELQVLGTGTLANLIHPGLNAITLATGAIEIGTRQMSDGANAVPADTNILTVEFDVLPVESPELAIVTTTTPDQVIVGAVGQASENVNWRTYIWIGDLRRNSAATASE